MNATQLLAHFDRLAEAPNAVPRLRRFILDLAVRGKLVEQDAGDEPAAELLKRIQADKTRLAKSGGIRKATAATQSEKSEMTFNLPVGWAMARFADYANEIATGPFGSALHQSDYVLDGIPLVNPSHMQNCRIVPDRKVTVSTATAEVLAVYRMRAGDIVMARRGEVGRAAVVTELESGWLCGKGSFYLRFVKELSRDYIILLLRCDTVRRYLAGEAVGTTMVNLNHSILKRMPLAIPPLAEQHRIVAKVDELMALCDQLEAAQQERERRRDRLAAASLQRLNQPALDATPEAQREHARFHLHHLPRLTTRPEHIKAMRQMILNLAVRGGLVRQDAGEDSAIGLLSAIAAAKSRLAKAGEIRKVVDLGPLTPENAVFQVPDGWAWERLGTVGYTQTGTTPPTSMPECFGGDTPFVTPSDLTASVTTYDGKGLTEIGVKHSRLIAKNSVLMVCIGSTIGKVNVVDREICCNQQINTLTPVIDGMTGYLAIVLRSNYFQELVIANAGMGTLPILSKGKWELLPVPIPPLAEQHRIVAKVDELMALCDRLDAQLTTTQTDSRRLLEAVLEVALDPA